MKRFVLPAVIIAASMSSAVGHAAEGTVADLIKQLAATDVTAQVEAAEALEALGPNAAEAVPALTKLLAADSPDVQAHAAQALGAIGDAAKPAAQALSELIGSEQEMVRREAVEALGAIRPGPKVMLPILGKLLQDSSPAVRSRVLHALADRAGESTEILIAALKNEDTAYWACVVVSEVGADAAEAVEPIVALLDNDRHGVRREAILALAAIGKAAAPAAEKLETLVDDPINGVPAIYALGSIGKVSSEVKTKLVAKAQGDDPVAKTVSAWALAKLHPGDVRFVSKAIKLLVATLKSEDPQARLAAAKALESLDADPEIFRPIMLEALENADHETVTLMLDTMVSLGPAMVPKLVEGLKNAEARPYICYMLGQFGPDAAPAVGALTRLVGTDDPDTQSEAILALAEIGPAAKAAVPALVKALDAEHAVKVAAVYALGRIGADAVKAKPSILSKMDTDEDVAVVCAWALARIHPECPTCREKAVPVLIKGLSDDNPHFREEAANGLCCFGAGAKPAIDALKKAAEDSDEAVRDAAAKALKAIDK